MVREIQPWTSHTNPQNNARVPDLNAAQEVKPLVLFGALLPPLPQAPAVDTLPRGLDLRPTSGANQQEVEVSADPVAGDDDPKVQTVISSATDSAVSSQNGSQQNGEQITDQTTKDLHPSFRKADEVIPATVAKDPSETLMPLLP